MKKKYVCEIIDDSIASWLFKKGSTAETFGEAFEEFTQMIGDDSIDKLMVEVQGTDAWTQDIHDVWLMTGEVADKNNIKKWGIVTPDSFIREATILRLVKGDTTNPRSYQYLVSRSKDEVLEWLKN